MRRERELLWITAALLLLIAGCQPQGDPLVSPSQSKPDSVVPTQAALAATPVESETPAEPSQEREAPEPLETQESVPAVASTVEPQPEPITIRIAAEIPAQLRSELENLPADRFQIVEANVSADLVISTSEGSQIAQWIYVPVERFATFSESLTETDLGQAILVTTEDTAAVWESLLPSIQSVENETLSNLLWSQPGQIGLVPFDQLSPDLKPLAVMGMSVLDRDLDVTSYPLSISYNVSGKSEHLDEFFEKWGDVRTNRDENKMTTVAMTGVTALVRATAAQMESQGILFPGEVVAPILQAADIAHISNEVPFAENCPYPDAFSQSLVFCSRDIYFELLTHLEADVIEVTGNHSNDWGRESMVRSLEFYEEAGMQYYGGGRNLEDGLAAAVFEDHGNKIAFIGCNPVGPTFAWATATAAGATPCGDYTQIESRIIELAQRGHVVIATMQYQEIYAYQPTANQVRDYGRLAAAGAAAVSGSQSHHPQGFAFQNGSFIHYGLGNLFFDQMDQLGTRQMFIDTYVVYDNRLISVELWTGLIEFYARPREMTPAERETLLRSVFTASGW